MSLLQLYLFSLQIIKQHRRSKSRVIIITLIEWWDGGKLGLGTHAILVAHT